MRRNKTRVVLLLVVLGLFVMLVIPRTRVLAAAGINQQLSFEGKLVKSDNTNITDSTYNMEFKIYQDGTSSGSGSTLLWTEDYLVAGSSGMPSTGGVTLSSGTFQVNLGSVCSGFAAGTCGAKTQAGVDFNQQTLWLSVQVGNTSSCTVTSATTSFNTACGGDGEMTPFIRLTAVPQAMNASNLDGIDSTGFIQNTTTQQATSNFNISGTGVAATALQAPLVQTADVSSASALLTVRSGNATTSGNTGGLMLGTGAATSGNSGSIAVDVGTASGTKGSISIGSSVAAAAINLGGVGNTTIASIVHIGDTSGNAQQVVTIGSAGATNSTVTIEGGTAGTAIQIGNGGTAHGIQIGSGAGVNTVVLGSTNTTSATTIQAGSGNITLNDGNGNKVVIGSATTDTNQVLLQVDSFSTFADTASCSTTNNQGALYYNSTSTALRACLNGGWEDLVSTAGLGVIAYGVVPDSGTDPGDLISNTATAHTTGPCKVSWNTSTTVKVDPCTAYSGGRKVIVPATTMAAIPTFTNGNYVHVCLNGTNNQPAYSTSGTETADSPTFSINSPVVCLADITTSASAITGIFDTRTFTTSIHEFVTTNAAMGLGWIACPIGQQVTTCATTTAGADSVEGVIVAINSATTTSTTTPNAIMTVEGPTFAKALLTANVAGDIVYNSTTSERVQATVATSGTAGTGLWGNLGVNRSASSSATACTSTASAANCDYGLYFEQQRR